MFFVLLWKLLRFAKLYRCVNCKSHFRILFRILYDPLLLMISTINKGNWFIPPTIVFEKLCILTDHCHKVEYANGFEHAALSYWLSFSAVRRSLASTVIVIVSGSDGPVGGRKHKANSNTKWVGYWMGSFPTPTAGPSQPLPKPVVQITEKLLEIFEKYQ